MSRRSADVARLAARGAGAIAPAWGAAEATLFFVVPDVWVGLVALLAPRRTLGAVAGTIAGALAGTLVLYLAGRHGRGRAIDRTIARLPGISPTDIAHVEAELQTYGFGAFVRAPLRGVPLKLYTRESQRQGWSLPRVLVGATANRIVRLVPVAGVFALLEHIARRRIEERPRAALAAHAVAWAAFYAWYWRR